MIMGPEPMIRIFRRSVRFGMSSQRAVVQDGHSVSKTVEETRFLGETGFLAALVRQWSLLLRPIGQEPRGVGPPQVPHPCITCGNIPNSRGDQSSPGLGECCHG